MALYKCYIPSLHPINTSITETGTMVHNAADIKKLQLCDV